MKLTALVVDLADKFLGRLFEQRETADDVLDHANGVVDLAAQCVDALLSFPLRGSAEFASGIPQQAAAVGAEDVGGQELVELVDDGVFADPEASRGGVPLGDVPLLRGADVVGVASAGLAVHAAAAVAAEQVGAQQVAALGLGMFDVGVVAGAAGAEAVAADVLGLQPVLQGDESFVDGFRGPDPFPDGVGAVSSGLASAAVPHHVPGVLGIGEDVAHVRVGPAADGTFRVDGDGRRVAGGVEVEAVRDGLVAEPFGDSPVVCLAHRGRLGWVDVEEGFLGALGALGGNRVRYVTRTVAVAGFADVVPGFGVGSVAVPGLLQHVYDVKLGDALLDPPGQQLRGSLGFSTVHCGQLKGLVCGKQAHSGALQAMFDGGAVVHVPGGALDRLADDIVEPPIRPFGLGEQILDTPVTRDRDVELFVRAAASTSVEIHAPGLDVVEMRDDEAAFGKRALRRPQLARQGEGRVLHVPCGHTAQPCEAKNRRLRGGAHRFAARRFAVTTPYGSYAALSSPPTDLFRACHSVTSHNTRACSAASR
ncbi:MULTISPECIES: hypothetical protein [Amycolatopsis]|uniref:hypothetical protein n=1 Tax=Amycolatopsis sp. La24 TaxID=3028304 RepID=UPI001EE9AED2|nr:MULTISPECIES: hypothetical protein [Amycolatopsis]